VQDQEYNARRRELGGVGMKRLRLVLGSILAAVVISGVSLLPAYWGIGTPTGSGTLSLAQVVAAFRSAGISLDRGWAGAPAELAIKGVRPAVYRLDGGSERLYIYVFPSIGERKAVCDDGRKLTETSVAAAPFRQQGQLAAFYCARNILLAYTPGVRSNSGNSQYQIARKIEELTYTRLNGGRKLVFQGEGPHWQAEIVYLYYAYRWTDSSGREVYESRDLEYPALQYKGSDAELVGQVNYKMETYSGGMGGSIPMSQLRQSGLGSGGGSSGPQVREDDVFTATVEWSGRQERFTLVNVPRLQLEGKLLSLVNQTLSIQYQQTGQIPLDDGVY
jgi:hypothetical protein